VAVSNGHDKGTLYFVIEGKYFVIEGKYFDSSQLEKADSSPQS
jgi:hypothetical protein